MSRMEKIFTHIYENSLWGKSRYNNFGSSGSGNDVLYNRDTYIPFLQKFIKDNNIKTIADFGCGEFICGPLTYYNLDILYTGYDVYKKVIDFNLKHYHLPKYNFIHLDILKQKQTILNADMCILKDVLQHWSINQIYAFLDYLIQSRKFKYILIVNCCDQTKDNINTYTGGWRQLTCNLLPLKKYNPEKIFNYGTKEVSVIRVP